MYERWYLSDFEPGWYSCFNWTRFLVSNNRLLRFASRTNLDSLPRFAEIWSKIIIFGHTKKPMFQRRKFTLFKRSLSLVCKLKPRNQQLDSMKTYLSGIQIPSVFSVYSLEQFWSSFQPCSFLTARMMLKSCHNLARRGSFPRQVTFLQQPPTLWPLRLLSWRASAFISIRNLLCN